MVAEIPLQTLFDGIFANKLVLYTCVVLVISLIGVLSESLSVMFLLGVTAFVTIALETGYSTYVTLTYILVTMLVITASFGIWGEFFGGNET